MWFGVGVAESKKEVCKAYDCFVHPMNRCTNQIHRGDLSAEGRHLHLLS